MHFRFIRVPYHKNIPLQVSLKLISDSYFVPERRKYHTTWDSYYVFHSGKDSDGNLPNIQLYWSALVQLIAKKQRCFELRGNNYGLQSRYQKSDLRIFNPRIGQSRRGIGKNLKNFRFRANIVVSADVELVGGVAFLKTIETLI